MLARRTLTSDQLPKIRRLRDDPEGRPWVRMAALDTLMEIEREKDAFARDKKVAEEKARNPKPTPSNDE